VETDHGAGGTEQETSGFERSHLVMTDNRIIPRPSATKRTSSDVVAPLYLPSKAVQGLRSLFTDEPAMSPAMECAATRIGSGIEAPALELTSPANHLDRTFAFVDVSGFTAYVDQHGEHASIALLTRFRTVTRQVTARRGVRVGKWLGDGVMLVGAEPGPTIATVAEMRSRFEGSGIDVHSGIAGGPVLLFEGDDYIGRPVNLAARLCDAAAAGEMLSSVSNEYLPPWVNSDGHVTVQVAGVGDVAGVHQLVVDPEVLASFGAANAA
jgi:adenylate cyclase